MGIRKETQADTLNMSVPSTQSPGFMECGENVVVYGGAKILSPETITVGSNVIIDDFVFIGAHRRMVVGNHVHIASHVSITGGGRCLICDFAGISSGTRILTGTDSFLGDALTGPTIPAPFRKVNRSEVVIGAHVIIGANAVVLPGVVIGEGAAIGAGSIVTKDLEPWGIYVGQPARRVRERPKEIMLQMERSLYEQYGAPRRRFRDKAALRWT
jgi:acetyltransferase-like isoleucine patch superfamily enzyme